MTASQSHATFPVNACDSFLSINSSHTAIPADQQPRSGIVSTINHPGFFLRSLKNKKCDSSLRDVLRRQRRAWCDCGHPLSGGGTAWPR